MAFESRGGMGDSAVVSVVGHDERLARWKAEASAVMESIPPCSECGGERRPIKAWNGWRSPDLLADIQTKPAIKCSNVECKKRPRVTACSRW